MSRREWLKGHAGNARLRGLDRADDISDRKVIVEIKSVEAMSPVFFKTLLTYLRLTDIKLGLLVNFNVSFMKDGITRIANNL